MCIASFSLSFSFFLPSPLLFLSFFLSLRFRVVREKNARSVCMFVFVDGKRAALIGPTTSLVKKFRERKIGANSMSIVCWKYPGTSYFGDFRGKTVTIYSNFYLTDQFENNSLTLVNSSRQFNPHRKPKVSQLFIKICMCETHRLLFSCIVYRLFAICEFIQQIYTNVCNRYSGYRMQVSSNRIIKFQV